MPTGSSFDALPLRWRHVQATIRLLQVLHVLADVVRFLPTLHGQSGLT